MASDLKNYGPEHPIVASTLNDLGVTFWANGEYDKAIGNYEKALTTDLTTYGPEHYIVAIRWFNLGKAWQSKREFSKAREYYGRALAVFQKAGMKQQTRLAEKNLRSLPGG